MGRRKRNQDTIQVGNIDQAVESHDNQLQSVPVSEETLNPTETNSSINQVDVIPYDDRPIPEAYFPPEDETTQEYMPEPHIQQTVIPNVNYKVVSKKALDALKFEVKSAPSKETEPTTAESQSVAKEASMPKSVDLNALQFDVKQTDAKTVETKLSEQSNTQCQTDSIQPKVSSKDNIDFTTLKIDKYVLPSGENINGSGVIANIESASFDSLSAHNDSLSVDSLAKDSFVFAKVAKPEPKREIISIEGKKLPNTINNVWWYTPILILLFLSYTIIIRDRKKAIFSEMLSFIKPNTDGSIFGFQWLQNSKYKFFLSVLGVVSASLYLFLATDSMISAFWIFLLAVTIFVVGKKLLLSLLEYIYFQGADVPSMSGSFMVMVRQTGLLLIPSVLGLSFSPEYYRSFFIYLGIIFVVSAFLAFIFKVFVNFLRGITSVFYLILYLCTLEVIPLAIFFVLGLLPRV